MPHLSVEYSAGLDTKTEITPLCEAMHWVMVATDVFPTAGIRVRAVRADVAIVADGLPENNFVAMTLSVGAGRNTDDLHEAGAALFEAGQAVLKNRLSRPHFAYSLEIREINADLSWKYTPIHTRLSGQT